MFRYRPDSSLINQAVQTALNSGAEINELDRAFLVAEIVAGVPEPGSWFAAWNSVADLLVTQADEDEKARHLVSAAHKLRRAAVYYAIAERYIPHTDARKSQSFASMQNAFARYLSLAAPHVERVEVPFESGSLPALYIPAGRTGPVPTVVFIDGFDFYKEFAFLRMNADAARDRGMAMIIVDTPGVGETLRLRGVPTRFDSEVGVTASVDYLLSRSETDPDRIGLIGLSLGGYYAPRAAAFEKRLRCCVAWGGQWDWGTQQRHHFATADASRLSAPSSQLMWVTGTDSTEAALEYVEPFTLAGVADKITCPLLVVHGAEDHLVPLDDARKLAAGATSSPRVDLIITTAENGGSGHCCMDGMQSGVDIIYDWVADILLGIEAS